VGVVSPAILVWKSRSFLLSDQPSGSLNQVEGWLQQAVRLDDEYLPALLELAYFYLNVIDDATKALPLFKKAFPMAVENATEAISGLTESISETDSPEAALQFLEQNRSMIDNVKLEELKKHLLEEVYRPHSQW